jgi:hypothetical protein
MNGVLVLMNYNDKKKACFLLESGADLPAVPDLHTPGTLLSSQVKDHL